MEKITKKEWTSSVAEIVKIDEKDIISTSGTSYGDDVGLPEIPTH